MNFVFFSPHFPANGADFCDRLKKAGATVLGIGDAPFDALDSKLKAALSEYYRVADMEDYEPVFRAIGHFIHKWGRIDRFESLNEHWLELEANIRTDFNIYGTKLDFVKNLKRKSRMRAFFRKSGVETIAQRKCSDRAGAMTSASAIPWWSNRTQAPALRTRSRSPMRKSSTTSSGTSRRM
ncbi:SDR family oxidoreductase [Mesorhizobium sp. B2-3-11]|uniref:SDR family oxidoreductase n=1 Tax=Mesorhizobium sp. B2-3-11 TaxID=2589953 RepID=UPI001FEEF94C|nr:SDR family oxidoreductase [Mesorhizobium sp. B2-3-11]